MFHVLHPSTQGQAQCPTSPDKHTKTATIPFRALVFPPEGRQGAKASGREGALIRASCCTELCGFKDRAPST